MKNSVYTLVVVASRSIVVRDYKSVTISADGLVKEVSECTGLMSHTLVIKEKRVIFEHHRGEERKYTGKKEENQMLKNLLEKGEVIRDLTARELLAIEKEILSRG